MDKFKVDKQKRKEGMFSIIQGYKYIMTPMFTLTPLHKKMQGKNLGHFN